MIGLLLVLLAGSAQVEVPIFANGFDPPIPIGCPATIAPDGVTRTRLTTSPIGYGVQQITRSPVSLTEWDNVYGYNGNEPGPPVAWPGVNGSAPTFKNFRMTSFVALHFRTPASPPAGLASTFKIPTGIGSPPVTLSISRACGDFARYLPSPKCVATSPSNDQPILYYHFGAGACELKPGTEYYLNAMYPDTTNRTKCTSSGATCRMAAWR